MKAVKALLMVTATLLVTDFAFAQTWTPTSSPSEAWNSLASSADGSKLIATFVPWQFCVSTNGGATWATNNQPVYSSSVTFLSVATSADATEIVGVGGTACWVSTDFGNTWSSNNVPGATVLSSVAMSADGTKLVVASGQAGSPQNVNGPICISTNSGMTWSQTKAPTNNWVAVASSADGSKLVAAVHSNNQHSPSGNCIYISTNSGTSWIMSDAPTNIAWWSVASSADGRKVVAANAVTLTDPVLWGSVYTSTDSGMTWKSNDVPAAEWWSVSSSSDGTRLVAIGYQSGTGIIYSSTNSGANWVSNSLPSQVWRCVASSADGRKLVAASESGNNDSGPGSIYSLQTTPVPKLNLAGSGSNLALSWTIPSTNFVLQQSSDLTSWADVTNSPALNLTNLQNQITLSPSNSSGFYRLKTP